MNYKTFTGSQGERWEVWLVFPNAAERRQTERRVLAERRAEFRPHAPERRISTDRRRFNHRRVGVAAIFSNGWLCFEHETEKRRLAPVPDGWETADGDQLRAWCQAAKRVMKCGPTP